MHLGCGMNHLNFQYFLWENSLLCACASDYKHVLEGVMFANQGFTVLKIPMVLPPTFDLEFVFQYFFKNSMNTFGNLAVSAGFQFL